MPPTLRTRKHRKHVYRITPRYFSKLHPVHYHIFEILKKEIPFTLIQTCKILYDELIPEIYRKVELKQKNYEDIIDGAVVHIDWDSELSERSDSDEDLESDEDALAVVVTIPSLAEPSSRVNKATISTKNTIVQSAKKRLLPTKLNPEEEEDGYKWRPMDALPFPGLKNEALSYAKTLSFTHPQGAIDFIEDSSYCTVCGNCNSRHNLSENSFPNVEHLHLGQDVVSLLAEFEVLDEIPKRRFKKYHRLGELLENIWKHCRPTSVCIDWPKNWDKTYWNRNLDFEDLDHDEDWAIKDGIKGLMRKISTIDSIRHISVHVDIKEFKLVTFDVGLMTHHADLTFYVNNLDNLKTLDIIKTLWNHYKSDPYHYRHAFGYCPPMLGDSQNASNLIKQSLKSTDHDRFEFFISHRVNTDDWICRSCA